MPRVKKSEKKEEPVVIEEKKPDYGTGLTRVNNMLRAGFTMKEIMEEERKWVNGLSLSAASDSL